MFANYLIRISASSLAVLVILLSCVTNKAEGGPTAAPTGCGNTEVLAIGMENGLIIWSQLSASSSFEGYNASDAKLNGAGHWLPAEDDIDPWLQVDFAIILWLEELTTQGASSSDQWVMNFTISYAINFTEFTDLTESGAIKVFPANTDRDTKVKTVLPAAISVRFLRIHPKSWSNRPALRLEYHGCYKQCSTPKALPFLDSQITSENFYSDYTARHARLEHSGGWISQNGQMSWLMIDFLQRTTMTGITVRGSPVINMWSPSFTFEYSNNGYTFETFKEHGSTKTFSGIIDASTTYVKVLSYPIFARFLRFRPALSSAVYSGTGSSMCALRVEVKSCESKDIWFNPVPLGMSNKLILDSQMKVSSSKFYTSGADNGRKGLTSIPNVRHGGWIAADHDSDPWFQVDFIVNVTVSMLYMQGLSGTNHSVTKYTIASSDDGETFSDYKTNNQQTAKVFSVISWQDIFPHIFARFIRIYPKEWNSSCAMRVEFYGRYKGCYNPEDLGMENKKILGNQLSASREASADQTAPCGRLNGKGWLGGSGDFDMWYQVDFMKRAKVTTIKTQGGVSYYVNIFKLSHSNNGIDFPEYVDVMGTKKFTGQDDITVTVEHQLTTVIFSRFLRLHVIEHSGSAEFRLEFIGCYIDTILRESIPLGMENGLILDSQLSASSEKYYYISGAASGRLNSETVPNERHGGWIAADDDSAPWLQVDFIINATITAIITQGLDTGGNYVKEYTVTFNNSKTGMQNYIGKSTGQVTVLNATDVKQDLDPYILAHIVRIKPKTWVGNCALRVEFLGWYEGNSNSELLGMFNRSEILDSQIRSSVQTPVDHGSHAARLNFTLGWLAEDSGDYIQVDFGRRASITEIWSQGAGDGSSWTRNFTVAMSNDGVNFLDYEEYGARKTFFANIDQSSIVVQKPMHVIFARFIRIIVDHYVNLPGLRLEFVGSLVDTNLESPPVALGMEDRSILDSQILASSTKDYQTSGAAYARLNLTTIGHVSSDSWIAAENDNDPWLQVDFISNVTISEISTQGLENRSSYVTSYALAFGNKSDSLQDYQVNGQVKEFYANYNISSIIRQPLKPVIFARFIRIRPKTWTGDCALRVEFYGEYEECTDPQPLGIENGHILDSQLYASALTETNDGPQIGRLNMLSGGTRFTDGPDGEIWVDVDFIKWTKIIGIKIQGAAGVFDVIQTFTVAYSGDRNNFVHYKEYDQIKIFTGNTEIDTVVEQRLSRTILARFLRIIPDIWFGENPGIRMEVTGTYLDTDWFQPVALGIEDSLILDSQMAISSYYSTSGAGNARLNLKTLHENVDTNSTVIVRYGGWIAAEDDNDPWFQVDFIANATISSIFTQGLENGTSWVTKYSIAFGYNRDRLQNYSINGQVKVFSANFNHSSMVKNDVYPHIMARILRIMPKEWIGYCALRVEFYGQYEECTDPQPLGLQNGNISDSQLSSSTKYDFLNGPHNARLNLTAVPDVRAGGAQLDAGDSERWFQVDFLKWTKVTGSKTQGHNDIDFYIKKFSLHYSSDGVNFREYKEYGRTKVYPANYDQTTIVEQRLDRVLLVRFLRIIPKKWKGRISTRMEFLGSYVDTDWFDPVALGMESRLIVDSQLAVSSFKDSKTSGPGQARLNVNATTQSISTTSLHISAYNATMNVTTNITTVETSYVRHGGWIAADDDNDPWFQVDFRTNVTVTALVTQGLDSGIGWVTKYTLAYGYDKDDLQDYNVDGEIKVFSANYNVSTSVRRDLYPYLIARFVRIKPKIWIAYCALRVEFYGRYEGGENVTPLGMENGTILHSQVTASSTDNYKTSPPLARLNLQETSTHEGGWLAGGNDLHPWLQVDFLEYAKVTAIITQGRQTSTANFVHEFTMSYGNNNEDFQQYEEFGIVKVFTANYDKETTVKQRLTRVIYARFIRLNPTQWEFSAAGMRAELVGCYVERDWFESWPLGMESHVVLDFQLSASSSKYSLSGADKVRLNLNYTFNTTTSEIETYGGWIAADDDSVPWLQVDFITNVTISGIATLGEDEGEAWVTSYEISYGYSKNYLQDYQVDGQVKVFSANIDQNSTVRHDLQRPFVARYIQVKPKSWNSRCGMRVEFYGQFEDQDNSTYLGMKSGLIRDGQITASSQYDWPHRAAVGRLNFVPIPGNVWNGWRPLDADMNPWFQVDFETFATVTSIRTQGLSGSDYWVKTFIVSFGNDGINFQDYIEFGMPKVFIGNYGKNIIVRQRLLNVIFARFVRLKPTDEETYVGLRVEFNGYYIEYDCVDPIPLGLESNLIANSQLKSSSEKDETTQARNARLRLKPVDGERVGAWMASADDGNPWLKIDFKSNATVRGITTQGRYDVAEWVTSYEVSYSIDGITFDTYEENGQVKVFSANFDSNSTVKQYLDPPIFARYISLHPKQWSGSCALRAEFHGCYEDCMDPQYLGLASYSISDIQINSSSDGSGTASQARLNLTTASWVPASDDLYPWLEVDFMMRTKVREILSQGRDHEDNWVTSYIVSYSSNGKTFQDYTEYDKIKVFSGNYDRSSIVRHVLTRIIFTNRIRIHPKTWITNAGLRLEFAGCNFGCIYPNALGMEAGHIEDSQISDSSSWKYDHAAFYGRLKSHGSWIPGVSEGDDFVTVDFLHTTLLTGIAIQGGFLVDSFVTDFTISLKSGDNDFTPYQENGAEKVFLRHAEANTTVSYRFPLILVADSIRVTPLYWNGTKPAMRLEFMGCYEDTDVCDSSPCQNNGTCNDHFTTYNFFNCTCADGYTGRFCETECLDARPLGMSGGQIKDDQITASSTYDMAAVAPAGRLNASAVRRSGGWVAAENDGEQWFQVDFLVNTTVASILTQGRDNYSHWVETYQMSYSNDGISFRDYNQGGITKIFNGNSDRDTVVWNTLYPRVFTRFVRIHPKICHDNCSLRAEFLGCYNVIPSRCLNPIALGMENKQIKDHQITASSELYDAKYRDRCTAANGRANATIFSRHSTWIALLTDQDMWFEVDFLYNTTVKEIMTQGRQHYDQWVNFYKVTYRNETDVDAEFHTYEMGDGFRDKVFKGNSDRNTIVGHALSPVIRLLVIRILPLSCNGTCALRAEFVGCYEDADVCDPSPCLNNATCNDHFDFFNFFNCTCLGGYTGELCETEIDECLSYPCLNNGTCNDFVDFYNCTCTINYHGANCQYEVIWPIANFSVPFIPAQLFGQNISTIWDMDQGSYVTVEVYYNELLCCSRFLNRQLNHVGSQCNCSISDPALFDPDGVVDFRIYAYNNVSNVTVTLEVEVLKIIENVGISALTSFANWGIGVEGTGSQKNVFPTEYPVKLSAIFDGGPASIVDWTFSCTVSPSIPDENELSFDKTFPSDIAQLCDITLVLTNNISTGSASTTIDLKESIIFTSFTYDGPLKPNQTMTFTISFEKFGQGTCVVVDMGDNSSLLVFGEASCETKFDVSQINPNIVEEPLLTFSERTPETSAITIEHEFPGVGDYAVKMSAANLLANVTESLVAVVIPFVCKYPNITITGLAPNDSNLLAAAQVYRSVPIFVATENEIYCEVTNYVNVSWTVYKIDDDPNILTTTPRMKISDLGKSVFHTGIISPDLFLPERDLPFGYYEISARVEMWGLQNIFGIGTLYIQVVQTPWISAAVTTGSFYTVPFKEPGSLNASASIDPDFNNTDGMSFAWYCRDVEDSEFQLSDLAKEPLVTAPGFFPDPDLGGCFGTGRGRLKVTDPIIEFDTGVMVEDKAYAISLFVSTSYQGFAVRQHLSNIFFHVAKGLPPGLVVGCAKNCEPKVARDEKLILKSKCNIRCYGELAFTWTLYRYDNLNTPEPYNLSALHEFTSNELKEMTTSPIDALEIALKPKSLEPVKKYILAFRAFRPNGVFGELRYTLLTNDAPVDGTCSIFPLSGVAMETNFTVSCANWVDNEAPLTVEFSHQIKGVKTVFFFREIPTGARVSATLWLQAGDENSDYRLNVSAVVKDRLGAKASEDFTVEVVPQPAENIDLNQLQNLASEDAMRELFETGNGVLAIGLASNIASTLNGLGQNTTSNDSSLTQQQKDASKQIRKQLFASLASANLSAKDTSSLEQMSGTVLALTKNPDELEPDSQGAALQLTETLTSNLKGLSDGDKGFSNVLRGASNLVGGIGQMTTSIAKEASNTSSENGASDQVKRSIGLVDNIQGVLLDNLVSNEPPVNIESDELSMQVEKVMIKDASQRNNGIKGAKFGSPSPGALGIGDVVGNRNSTILQMQPVDIKIAVVNKNPFSWDNTTSKSLSSSVVDIKLQSDMNVSTSNVSEDFSITIPRDATLFPEPDSFFLKPSHENTTAKTKEYLKYHRFERKNDFTSINFEMRPEEPGIQFRVYLKKGSKPDIMKRDFELQYELPDLSSCLAGNESVFNSSVDQSESDENKTIYVDLRNCTRDPYTVFVSNVDMNGAGRYWFAVQHLGPLDNNEDDGNMAETDSRRRRSVSCEGEGRRVRRSCVIIPPAPPKPTDPPRVVHVQVPDTLGFDGKFFFPNQTPNYNLSMFESSCLYWNEENETWTGEGCKVVLGTNREQILCKCNHLTSFGSELLVAPNPIDFDSVFNNFGSLAENVAVLALISTILGGYIIGVIWARRADKRDLLMVGPTILTKPKGSYHYLITTYTGSRRNAATTAKVVFKMSGDKGETCSVRLRDRHRPCFERQQENAFVVSYPQGIGDLSYVQIWHDNSGSSPSWYLSRILVKDLQTEQMWSLFCENWLAVESEDGKVCRILPVANDEEMINFSHLFSARAIKGLADGHIWFSIVSRPPTSNFTRVQRLSCALCLLCCTMITSAMFYNMGGEGPSPFAIHIGSLVIDLKPFVIGLQSSVVIVPVNVLIVQIFRNLRPKKKKDDSEEESKARNPNGVKIEDPNQEQPKGKLPYWCIYFAYALCYLASAASIFFTLLYSIQWGKETSTEWVIAMVTSFLQSALLLQPVKVVVLAVVFAIFIRKPADTEESNITLAKEHPLVDQQENNLLVTQPPPPREGKKVKKYLSPPGPAKLKKARAKRLKEIKMNAALTEIFAFFFFLFCLMDVAQYHRDPSSYLLSKTLSETFVNVDSFSIPLDWIVDADSLWMWSRETLIPGLYAGEWYNGKKIEKGYLANMEDYLVGVPRVRMVRVKNGTCTVSSYFEDTIADCNAQYSVANGDDENYNVGWKPLDTTSTRKRRGTRIPESEEAWLESVTEKEQVENDRRAHRRKRAVDPIQSGRNRRRKNRLLSSERPKTYTVQSNAVSTDGHVLSCLQRWRHQSMLELRGFPYWGTIAVYGGSGYAANLGYDQLTAYTVVADLHSNGWISKQTRAVFVEFTVYNANTNLFGIVSIFIEYPSSTGVVNKVQLQAARFYLQLNGGQTLAHVLVIFFMLYFLYREGKLLHKQRWTYFKGFWNWVETILVISEFSLIILFLARLFEVDRNLLQLRENPNDYVAFQYAGQADAAMTAILGILVFFYILRFLRLLRFNKNFLIIGTTLSRISGPIFSFFIPFLSGYLAFGLFAFSVFGSELEDYSTFVRTMVTQLSMTLGDFDFEALMSVSVVFGSLYFFAFIGLNVMVLMNIFIAIINDSYAEVQEETAEMENEFELVDYVVGKISEKFTRSKPSQRRRKRKKKRRVKNNDDAKLIATNNCSTEVDLMCDKLGKLLEAIEHGVEEDNKIETQICSVPEEKKDSYYQLLCLIESDLVEEGKSPFSPADMYAKYVEIMYLN